MAALILDGLSVIFTQISFVHKCQVESAGKLWLRCGHCDRRSVRAEPAAIITFGIVKAE